MTNESKSKLEEVLKGERGTGSKAQADPVNLQSALERELESEDTELAKDLQRTRAEELITRRRIAIERMRGGQAVQDTGGGKTAERGKEWITDIAQGLLERKLDPAVVGRTIDYLLGAGQFPQVGFPGAGAPAQGMTFADVQALFKMGQEANKSDPAIATLLTRLADKVEALEKRPPPAAPPAERKSFIVVRPGGKVEEIEAGKPIIIEAEPVAGEEPIEVVKEKNRHAEEMEKLKNDKEYKTSVAETLASIPEKIGRGIASQVSDGGDGGEPGAGASERAALEKFKCENPECGKEFMIPADALKIQCPFCQSVYTREQQN